MTDSYDSVTRGIVFVLSSTNEAPGTALSTDEEHRLRALEDMNADIRFQVTGDHDLFCGGKWATKGAGRTSTVRKLIER